MNKLICLLLVLSSSAFAKSSFEVAKGLENQGYNNNFYTADFEHLEKALKISRPEEDWLLDNYMFILSQKAIVNRAKVKKDASKTVASGLGFSLPLQMFTLFYDQLISAGLEPALCAALEKQAVNLAKVDYPEYLKAARRKKWQRTDQIDRINKYRRHLAKDSIIDGRTDVPFVAGYATDNPKYIFVDRDIPVRPVIGGQAVPIWELLLVHERVEKALLDKFGLVYQSAHQIALRSELQTALALGVSWKGYDEYLVPVIAKMAEKPLTKVSKRLQLLPYYSYDDADSIALVGRMKAVMVDDKPLVQDCAAFLQTEYKKTQR